MPACQIQTPLAIGFLPPPPNSCLVIRGVGLGLNGPKGGCQGNGPPPPGTQWGGPSPTPRITSASCQAPGQPPLPLCTEQGMLALPLRRCETHTEGAGLPSLKFLCAVRTQLRGSHLPHKESCGSWLCVSVRNRLPTLGQGSSSCLLSRQECWEMGGCLRHASL